MGFLLFVIGIGGRMPSRLKIGDNEAEWQEEREAVQEFVERVAVDSPEVKRGEMIDALDTLAMAAPEVANPALSAMAYEALVLNAIAGLSRESADGVGPSWFRSVGPPPGPGNLADAILESVDGTKIAIEIKAWRSGFQVGVLQQLRGILHQLEETGSGVRHILLISRSEVKSSTADLFSGLKGISLLVLKDVRDSAALRKAIDAAFDDARILKHEADQGN